MANSNTLEKQVVESKDEVDADSDSEDYKNVETVERFKDDADGEWETQETAMNDEIDEIDEEDADNFSDNGRKKQRLEDDDGK